MARCSCGAPIECTAPKFGGRHVPPEIWMNKKPPDKVQLVPSRCFWCEGPHDYVIAEIQPGDELEEYPGGMVIHSWVDAERIMYVCAECWEIRIRRLLEYALAPFFRSVIHEDD